MDNVLGIIVGLFLIVFAFRKRPKDFDDHELFKEKSSTTGLFGMLFDSFYRILPWWLWRIVEVFIGSLFLFSSIFELINELNS